MRSRLALCLTAALALILPSIPALASAPGEVPAAAR
jgi:hypothetical protein